MGSGGPPKAIITKSSRTRISEVKSLQYVFYQQPAKQAADKQPDGCARRGLTYGGKLFQVYRHVGVIGVDRAISTG